MLKWFGVDGDSVGVVCCYGNGKVEIVVGGLDDWICIVVK